MNKKAVTDYRKESLFLKKRKTASFMTNILKLIVKEIRKFDKDRSQAIYSTLNEVYNVSFKDAEKVVIKKHFKTVYSDVKS